MIEYFKLKNFMSYRDETELSFVASNKSGGKNEIPVSWYKVIDGKRILKLLLGIGLNGTGKTKMIRGLSYLRRLATLKPEKPTDKPDYRPFLLDEHSAKEPTEMWLSYYINEENFLYYIKVNRDRIEEEELRIQTNSRSSRIYRRVYNYEKETIEISFGQSSDLNKNDQRDLEVNIVNNATVLSQFGSMNLESRILRLNYDYFENRISRVHQGDKTLADKLDTGNKEHDERMKELLLKLLSDIGSNIVDYHVDISSYYYSGMALGFDMLAAEVILSLKVSLPFLKLIAVVPFRGQSASWPMAEQQRYARILSRADEVILLSENYFNGCYLRRNDYMLSHSDNVIAYYDGKPMGGTAYTCRKARGKRMEIINVF